MNPKTPSSRFIFRRTAILCALAILPVVTSTTRLVTLVIEKVTGHKRSPRFTETGVGHLLHQLLRGTAPIRNLSEIIEKKDCSIRDFLYK
jgi:hypothetical protein